MAVFKWKTRRGINNLARRRQPSANPRCPILSPNRHSLSLPNPELTMRTQFLIAALVASSALARPLDAANTSAVSPVVKDITSVPKAIELVARIPAEAEDPKVDEAGVFEVFEAAYNAVKELLRKLKPQVKIPGYTHYVG
ncbi:hypothetical protein PLEOSDRAFT_1106639 [Pleurotus ostreatus PC15]|uniref:Uncharacterized protein n=1 Tax=Pleurotus ostreatus (strain PC15) TaxID=1137138 RepID=A0A067NFI0_PLEO1|nr:hypothetical protein PLEOSDRAFT_1106639 [Pleurotus ostreatus PC15]